MVVAKYSANGNDFVLFHAFTKVDRSELAKRLCHRQNGIGADGLIVLLPHATYNYEWQFYNSDGSEAAMCGNGSRACAHYAVTNGLAPKSHTFLTLAGAIHAEVDGARVKSELTPPKIISQEIREFGAVWWLIDTGVPHLVALSDTLDFFDVAMARELRYKYNANVNVAKIDSAKNLLVRTYERGVEDETLACGTGMAACYLRGSREALLDAETKVYPKSGEELYLGRNEHTITFAGDVRAVFVTSVELWA